VLQEKPTLQLVSYYDDKLRFVNNGMGTKVIGKQHAMKFAWKPLLQSQKNALQSSSLLWHMIKGGLIIIGTMVGTNMVSAPWKLALLETMK
jgi:hypothetical protein